MENQLSEEVIEIIEKIVDGKINSLSYDAKMRKYNVEFNRDNKPQQTEVSKELVEEALVREISLDVLKRIRKFEESL